MRVTVAAPAKVNLWLSVGPPQASGYHDISTLFCALDLGDTVVLRKRDPDEGTALEVGFAPPLEAVPDLGPEDSNLALRAARLFLERAGLAETAHIQLIKRIPAGGGLGGGSSDAGSVLRALCRMHPRMVSTEELMELAASVGSDVPFFAHGAPLAHGAGRGERLTALSPLPPRAVVLVLPGFPVATGDAYGWLDQDRGEEPAGSPASRTPPPDGEETGLGGLSWSRVAERATNDFEGPVFGRHPELGQLRDSLRDRGARPALLAGSGSTVFGIFEESDTAEAAARALRSEYPDHRVILTRTRSR